MSPGCIGCLCMVALLSFSLQLGSWQRPTTGAVGHGQTPSGSGYGFVFLSGRGGPRGIHSRATGSSLLAGSIVLPVPDSPGFRGCSSRRRSWLHSLSVG